MSCIKCPVSVTDRPRGESIPKVIHVTFPDKQTLPEAIRSNLAFIRQLNPDHELRLYDNVDCEFFIENHYGKEILNVYLLIDPDYGAARADLFRYLCIYQAGGVYLDCKSRPLKPFSSVVRPDDRYIIAQWNSKVSNGRYVGWGDQKALRHVGGGEFQQWHVIGCAGHPFLKSVINRVLRNIVVYSPFLHGHGRAAVIHTTGPTAYTLAILPILSCYPHRRVDIEAEFGISYSMFPSNAPLSHHQLLGSHYATLIHPLVSQGDFLDWLYTRSIDLYLRARAGVRNILKSLRLALGSVK